MLFEELDVTHQWHVGIIVIMRLDRKGTHHRCINLRERRRNGSKIFENTNCIKTPVFNYVYCIVFVHMYAFYPHVLVIF